MPYYIDIHTHKVLRESEVFALRSLRLNEFQSIRLKEDKTYTIGLHPYFKEDIREEQWQAFRDCVLNYKDYFWGTGECGLDKRSEVPMEEQIDFFRRQAQLSEELQKPLVLHIVRAWSELLAIKRALKPKQTWIIHGFRGKPTLAKQLLDAGFYLGFGEHYHLESFLLAESCERAFLESDEGNKLSIQEMYKRSAQELDLDLEELKERYHKRFISLS